MLRYEARFGKANRLFAHAGHLFATLNTLVLDGAKEAVRLGVA